MNKTFARVTFVVVYDSHRAIGRENRLLVHLPEDLAHFRELTRGRTVIMGRRTFDSIGRPLPMRRNIVISRNPAFAAEGVERADSVEDALARCVSEPEVFIIGGATIYAQAMPYASRIVATELAASYPADAWFPPLPSDFQVTARRLGRSAQHPDLRFEFVTYERDRPNVHNLLETTSHE